MSLQDIGVTIPFNKRVFIYKIDDASLNKYSLLNSQPLLLENDSFEFQISSNFEFLSENKASKWLVGLSKEAEELFNNTSFSFSGQFSKLNFKLWTKTEPLSLSLSIGLYMTTNARDDVVIPMKKIINEVLPRQNGAFGSLTAPGISISSALRDTYKGAIAISIGKHFIYPCLIEKAQPTISTETDDNGDPIWGKLQLDISTLTTATQEMMNSILKG